MLIYIYQTQYYRTIKNGFLVDYFLKKYMLIIWSTTLIQFNYLFNDKYLIEFTSKTFYTNLKIIFNFFLTFQNISTIYFINFIILTWVTIVVLWQLWLL